MHLLLLPKRMAGDDLMHMAHFESCSVRSSYASTRSVTAASEALPHSLFYVLSICMFVWPVFLVLVSGTRPLSLQ